MNLSHSKKLITEDALPNFGTEGTQGNNDGTRKTVIPQDPLRDLAQAIHYDIDVWYLFVEKIFEFLQVPLCFGIKIAMVVLNLSTTCLFLATCLIISLKLVLCVENGLISGENNSYSADLFMLFCLQFMVLVTWAYATAVIISRQFEVLYLIFLVPVSLSSLILQQMAAEEEDPMKQQFLRFTSAAVAKVPYPKYPILSITFIVMLLFLLFAIILYGVGQNDVGNFFLIIFLIALTFVTMWFSPTVKKMKNIHAIDRPGNSMVSWAFLVEWVFMSVGALVTACIFLVDFGGSNEPYGGLPAFGKIVLGFVAASAVLNLLHVVKEAWLNPIYYIWVEFTHAFVRSQFRLAKIKKFILWMAMFLAFAALVLGIAAFVLYMSDADQDYQWATAFAAEIVLVVINLSSCGGALYVYAHAGHLKVKNDDDLLNIAASGSSVDKSPINGHSHCHDRTTANAGSATDDALERQEKGVNQPTHASSSSSSSHALNTHAAAAPLADSSSSDAPKEAQAQVEAESTWLQKTILSFQNIQESSAGWVMTDFVFFVFMIAGLGAGGADGATWVQAIIYFFVGSFFVAAVHYPIQTKDNDSYNDEFCKSVQFIIIIISFLLVIFAFPLLGTGPSTLFILMAYTHGMVLMLFDLLLSAPFPTVTQDTIDHNLQIHLWDQHVAFAKFSPMKVAKYSDRMFGGFYALAVVLNAIALLLSTFAETSPQFGAGGGAAVVVLNQDVEVSPNPNYGVCSQSVYSLNAMDSSYLVSLTYFKDPTNYSYDCGFNDPNNLQRCLNNYFSPSYTKPYLHNKPYDWVVLNISIPKSRNAKLKTAYYGIKSDNANVIVVGVRGSTTGRDWLEDFNLYVEITMLQVFSLIIPYIYIWPFAATGQVVKALSFVDSLTFLSGNRTYYQPVINYIEELQAKYPAHNFTVMGHSLGGATSGIVGAKMGIRSFNFEPPGTIYSALKFQIYNGLQPIHQTSTSIVRDYDPVPMVDLQGGNIQKLTCPQPFLSGYCHMMRPISCHLMTNCELMDSVTFDYWGGGMKYCGY